MPVTWARVRSLLDSLILTKKLSWSSWTLQISNLAFEKLRSLGLQINSEFLLVESGKLYSEESKTLFSEILLLDGHYLSKDVSNLNTRSNLSKIIFILLKILSFDREFNHVNKISYKLKGNWLTM